MNRLRSLLLVLFVICVQQTNALEYSVVPSARSYPTSGSIEAQVRDEVLLWDQRQDTGWKFGFLQPRLMVGAHGVAEGSLSLFPISFLELGASYSLTSRFYKTRPFDCDAVICNGLVQRRRLTARLAGEVQFESFKLSGLATFHRVALSTGDSTKPFVDELEVILAAPGSDTVESQSLLVAAHRDDKMLGLYAKKARMMQTRNENNSQYIIYRQKLQNLSAAVGVGRYASDYHEPGFSAVASISWAWGESISFF